MFDADTAKENAKEIADLDIFKALLSQDVSPFFRDNVALVAHINAVFDILDRIISRWVAEYLEKADPKASNIDDYAKHINTMTEIIRKHQPLLTLAQVIYEKCIELTESHCQKNKVDLHIGTLYANLGITFLEQGKYKSALPWLHAAAKQDADHKTDVHSIYDSYAFSETGIFEQWLDSYVLPHLPVDVLAFVNNTLASNYTNEDFKKLVGWLAGRGDLHVISSLLDYGDVTDKDDYHADSVRLSAIRDLATLTEVLLKQLGGAHKDPVVMAEFTDPPTFAGLICHMHFTSKLKQRRNNPALNASREPGLFHNVNLPSDEILDAIDSTIDYCADKTKNVDKVWEHLNANVLSADTVANAISKRMLLAYKLRNITSHMYDPSDPNMKKHYDDFRLWLLQAVSVLYFWAKKNGYATI
jgi:tetratricopeptide (TPR) repeat protein